MEELVLFMVLDAIGAPFKNQAKVNGPMTLPPTAMPFIVIAVFAGVL